MALCRGGGRQQHFGDELQQSSPFSLPFVPSFSALFGNDDDLSRDGDGLDQRQRRYSKVHGRR
ncbi:hypothetical protein HN51_053639 [Arachis hypogaea]